jgi:hypothetical protein
MRRAAAEGGRTEVGAKRLRRYERTANPKRSGAPKAAKQTRRAAPKKIIKKISVRKKHWQGENTTLVFVFAIFYLC